MGAQRCATKAYTALVLQQHMVQTAAVRIAAPAVSTSWLKPPSPHLRVMMTCGSWTALWFWHAVQVMEVQTKLRACCGGSRGRTTHPDFQLNRCTGDSSLARSGWHSGAQRARRIAQDPRAAAALDRRAPALSCCRHDAPERATVGWLPTRAVEEWEQIGRAAA